MMKKKSLISVIIPTYNRTNTLDRAILSVINQTYKNVEVIVVDDNVNNIDARNNTRKVIEKYKSLIDIKLLENKINLGGGLTRNEGIKVAKGELIAFLDDDDEFLPEKLEKQYQVYLNNINKKIGMIYCYSNMIKTNGTSYINRNDLEGLPLKENTKCCIAATSYWLCPKKALIDVGMFEDISSRQDASLITKFLLNDYNVFRVPEVLLNYYWHSGDGISKINEKSIIAEKKWMEIFDKNSKHLSINEKNEINYIFYSRLCHLYLLLKKKKEALNCIRKMIKLKKITIKNFQMIFGLTLNNLYIYLARKKDIRRKLK